MQDRIKKKIENIKIEIEKVTEGVKLGGLFPIS
jgi:hypothetical protein